MKKFLSLVLSLAMTLSLVTISASATDYDDLTDNSEIKYEEAVAVLNKLGIITGYEDGSFKPTGSLTRGAAAKIIVSMMIGADAASALTVSAAPYKDVPVTNTFAAVISYCKTKGYINGYTDGTFRPSTALSGFAFTKMLLGALGYDGTQEGFTGSGWTMNVASLGQTAGLFNDFDPSFAGGTNVDRESACLLALNTLKATEVEYSGGTNITTTTGNATTNVSTKQERSYKVSNNDKINQNINKTASGNTANYYTLEFGEDHFNDLKLTQDGSGTDDFGRPANEWTYKSVKIGTYALTPDYTYTSAPDGDTTVDEVKDMGLKDFYINKDTTLTVNGKDYSSELESSSAGVKTTTTTNAAVFDKYTTDGVLVEVYLDDDDADTIDAIVVVKTQLMQVSSVQSSKVTLKKNEDDIQNDATTVDFFSVTTAVEEGEDGYDVLKDLKADDYVLIVPVLDGSTYKVYSAAVPQSVTGIITSYATKSSNAKVKSVTVAGTTYKMSTMWTSEDGKLNTSTILSKTQESTVYLDQYGYAIYVSDVVDSNSAIVIDEIYSSVVDGKIVKYANGWNTDGDALSINLGTSNYLPTGYTSDDALQGKVFEYKSSTSNNADYKLVAHATTWTEGKLVYQASSTVGDATRYVKASAYQATVGGKSVQYASDVNFIFLSEDDGDITGITVSEGVTEVGSSTDTSKQYDLIYVLNDKGTKIVAVIVPNDDDAGNTENLMYIQKTTGYTTNDSKDRVALFTAYINGEKFTDCQSNKETVTGDSFYTYSKNDSTGIYCQRQ